VVRLERFLGFTLNPDDRRCVEEEAPYGFSWGRDCSDVEVVHPRSLTPPSTATLSSPTEGSAIVDSGASQHITNRKDWLSDFSECDGDVLTGKGSTKVKGCGKVKVKFFRENGGYTLFFSNVLCYPDLRTICCLCTA